MGKTELVRTTVALSPAVARRSKAEAAKDKRPWTHQLVVLIEEALAERAKKK